MMRRYVTMRRPRLAAMDNDPDAEDYLSRTVYEPDDAPQPTGLLDAQGNELYAINEMDPIGFIRFRDR